MKVKNIMFFGFAAAILSAGAANATYTTTNSDGLAAGRKIVASKAYVDSKADSVYTELDGRLGTVEATANGAIQNIVEGATNGTIAVDDVDVPVHGLDTAAYQPTTAFVGTVTSSGDGVVKTVSNNVNGTVTVTKAAVAESELSSEVQAKLNASRGVQAVTESDQNGKIDVDGTQVPIHGLGSAAYTASTDYDASGTAAGLVGTLTNLTTSDKTNAVAAINELDGRLDTVESTANGAVQNIGEGATNGTIAVDNVDVPVHGLGSAAYTASTDYDASGTAAGLVGTLTNLTTTNKTNAVAAINELNTAVSNLDTNHKQVPAKPSTCTAADPCVLMETDSGYGWFHMATDVAASQTGTQQASASLTTNVAE